MKIIILAAGRGTRLLPLTANTPKPLLDLGTGKTLLEEQIERMRASGAVDQIVLVVGYLAEQIEAKLQQHLAAGVPLRLVFNPFYDTSNNLVSLWLARHEMEEDFLVTNGDCIFSAGIYGGLAAESGDRIHLVARRPESLDDEDMKIRLDGQYIAEVSKAIAPDQAGGESPGLALVRGPRSRRLFVETLEALVRDRAYLDRFWLETFNRLVDRGVPIQPWWMDGRGTWQEIDFHPDVKRIRELLSISNV